MANHSEIENLVDQAVKLAREKQHEYVMTEHLLLAMLRQSNFRRMVERFGVEIDMLDQELDAYLNSLVNLIKTGDVQPKKTQSLERVFNRANVQMMFTNAHFLSCLFNHPFIMNQEWYINSSKVYRFSAHFESFLVFFFLRLNSKRLLFQDPAGIVL